jgi:hypothetical protein
MLQLTATGWTAPAGDIGHSVLPALTATSTLRAECTEEDNMANVYAQLDERLRKFILAQPIFLVVT